MNLNRIIKFAQLILTVFWGLFIPGYYYFLSRPAPWFQNFTALTLVILSVICVGIIWFCFNRYTISRIKKISLLSIIVFTIFFPIHSFIFENTTVKFGDGYEQVGFGLWKRGLTEKAINEITKNPSIKSNDELMKEIGFAVDNSKKLDTSIEKGWTGWSIFLALVLLTLSFVICFSSWALGFSLIALLLIKSK